MRVITIGLVAAMMALLVGCSGGGGGGGGGGGSTASANNVTLSGTVNATGPLSVPLQVLRSNPGLQPAYTALNQLALYCVTFTDPPHSGTGVFDASGNFSVTVNDAAGAPVGCFIVDTSAGNAVVTTLNFTIGSGGLTGGSSSSAAFDGGTHTISITFDPATNTATADVTATATAPSTEVTFAPADLTGEWTMTCSASNTGDAAAACTSMIGSSPTVFIDVITATMSGQTVYAMGAWPNAATFNAAGKTEGIYAAGLPVEITAVPTSLVAGADPTVAFTGFTSGSAYVRATNTMAAADAWAFLIGGTVLTDLQWDNVGGDTGNVVCATALPTSTDPWPASPTADQKICLLAYLDRAADEDAGFATPYFIPRVNWDDSSTQFVNGGGTDVIFKSTSIAQTPHIQSRFALMGLELAGNTAIASVHESESYSYEEEDTSTHSCSNSEGTTIVFVINSATSATGWFTKTEYESCDDNPVNNAASFQVEFTK